MKTTLIRIANLTIFLLLFSVISCDEAEELTQFDIDTTITEEITISLTDDDTSLNGSINFNLAENEDLNDYLDDIEDIEISNASYVIKNYVGVEEATGTISAIAASQSFGPYNHSFFTDAQNATIFEFTDTSKLNTVANNLLNSNQLNVQFSGTQDPAQNGSLTIEVTFQLTVTVQAL